MSSANSPIFDAKRLLGWLIDKELTSTTPRHLQQFSPLRDKAKRDSALDILIEHHMVRTVLIDNKSVIQINPILT